MSASTKLFPTKIYMPVFNAGTEPDAVVLEQERKGLADFIAFLSSLDAEWGINKALPRLGIIFESYLQRSLNASREEINCSEIFETAVLKHALDLDRTICSTINDETSVTQKASNGLMLNGFISINYFNLTAEQINQCIMAYKSYYGADIIPLAIDRSTYGVASRQDGPCEGYTVYFKADLFLKNVLSHLNNVNVHPVKQSEIVAQKNWIKTAKEGLAKYVSLEDINKLEFITNSSPELKDQAADAKLVLGTLSDASDKISEMFSELLHRSLQEKANLAKQSLACSRNQASSNSPSTPPHHALPTSELKQEVKSSIKYTPDTIHPASSSFLKMFNSRVDGKEEVDKDVVGSVMHPSYR